ncbi:hypothetical protein ACFXHA_32995 [Nocardia sp. NPDC059240]|uniref:hypothetical protein n=1 Tax=Nocardia sp. NPDC059240 TaxID=3346786 RepID=UPI0036C286DE
MPIPTATQMTFARGAAALAGLIAVAVASTLDGRPAIVADGWDVGSAVSPFGVAAGSSTGSSHKCLATGSAVSISGESDVTCQPSSTTATTSTE